MLAKTEKKQFETSSVESSPTTILGSNPKQIIYAFSIYTAQIIYLSFEFEFECEKNENKQKEAGIGPYLKKPVWNEVHVFPINSNSSERI